MNKFEDIGADPAEANEQLQGFEIKGDVESMEEEYNNLFEGFETAELEELRELMKDEEVQVDVKAGNIQKVVDRMREVGKFSEKAIQAAGTGLLLMFAVIAADPAMGAGREDALQGLETVQMRISKLQMPQRIVMGQGTIIAPRASGDMQMERGLNEYSSKITINGQPGRIIYQDNDRIVIGGEGSVYRNDGNGEVAIGTVIIE